VHGDPLILALEANSAGRVGGTAVTAHVVRRAVDDLCRSSDREDEAERGDQGTQGRHSFFGAYWIFVWSCAIMIARKVRDY
jgi:hypothetical protein